MLTSISPLGERARGNRWWFTVAWLTVGTLLGGAAIGAILGTLGRLAPAAGAEWRLAVMTLVGFTAAAWDLAGRRFPGRRQVNEDWLVAFRPWVYGMGYGLQLGTGVATVVNTALVPVVMVAALLTGDTVKGLALGSVFGAVRGLGVMLSGGVRTVDDLRRLHRRLDGMAEQVRRLGALVAAVLAAGCAVTWVT